MTDLITNIYTCTTCDAEIDTKTTSFQQHSHECHPDREGNFKQVFDFVIPGHIESTWLRSFLMLDGCQWYLTFTNCWDSVHQKPNTKIRLAPTTTEAELFYHVCCKVCVAKYDVGDSTHMLRCALPKTNIQIVRTFSTGFLPLCLILCIYSFSISPSPTYWRSIYTMRLLGRVIITGCWQLVWPSPSVLHEAAFHLSKAAHN